MPRILLHICCGPCTIHPVSVLRAEHFTVHGFFYNPHIQPYQEFQKRLTTLESYAKNEDLPLIVRTDYDLQNFFREVAFRETNRCLYCYSVRLNAAAGLAKKSRFDAFTTTLLYSRRQQHRLIVSLAEEASKRHDIAFFYRDFRSGWIEGQQRAKALGMYRQQYCGCIYSEMERFHPKAAGQGKASAAAKPEFDRDGDQI
jgi:predicted adenine nucleotide alpha hydrolase (AANH) superfamily ATPase